MHFSLTNVNIINFDYDYKTLILMLLSNTIFANMYEFLKYKFDLELNGVTKVSKIWGMSLY